MLILPVTYLGPIHYYARLMHVESVAIEQFCHYSRQTYRNRCVVMGANGLMSLTVPVVNGAAKGMVTKDVKIAYDTPWQMAHWRSIVSAYQSSPYFEYYMDDFLPFFTKKYDYLMDFNLGLTQLVCECIDMPFRYELTAQYEKLPEGVIDFREIIHPKKDAAVEDTFFKPIEYRQLFADKYGFQSNLSIIDLVFNKGPESFVVLRDSLIK